MEASNPMDDDLLFSMLLENEGSDRNDGQTKANDNISPNSSEELNTVSPVVYSDDEDIANDLFGDKDEMFLDSIANNNYDPAFNETFNSNSNGNTSSNRAHEGQQIPGDSSTSSSSLNRKNSFDSLSKLSVVSMSTYSSTANSTSNKSLNKTEKGSDDETVDIKKLNRKERNRQLAAESRMRKKLLMDDLMNENRMLKAKVARYESLYGPLPDEPAPILDTVLDQTNGTILPMFHKGESTLSGRKNSRKHKLNDQEEKLQDDDDDIKDKSGKDNKNTLPMSHKVQPPPKRRSKISTILTPLRATSVATIGLTTIVCADSLGENGSSIFSPKGHLSFLSHLVYQLSAFDILSWVLICFLMTLCLFAYYKLFSSSRKLSMAEYPIKRKSSNDALLGGYFSKPKSTFTLST